MRCVGCARVNPNPRIKGPRTFIKPVEMPIQERQAALMHAQAFLHTPSPRTKPLSKTETLACARGNRSPLMLIFIFALRGSG